MRFLPVRPRLLGILVALLPVAGSMTVAPAVSAASVLPVLWEGEVHDSVGHPAAAEVVAFLRPPAEALVPGVPLVPLARADTDGAGRFTIRALPTEAVRAATGESGWVTLLVA